MPEISGMLVLEKAIENEGTEVIMVTAYGSVESAVKAMKKGAADYILKPFALDEVVLQVGRLVEKQRLRSLSGLYEQEARRRTAAAFVGSAPAIRKVMDMIAKVAPVDATVLITGRSGTGKEVAARMIHEQSRRAAQPFIAVNCAALTETLLESELFGHEKGAFTGAVARKRGRFELAQGGTIFLDEVGEMSPGLQSKLLRVLEERQLVRVGGVDQIDIDVRVIAATNRDLKARMEAAAFREDLYFRLNVFPIRMPELCERRNDIVPLAEHFLADKGYPHRSVGDEVRLLLESYDWPGNVRELRNVIERATILAGGEPLSPEDFSLAVDDSPLAVSGSVAAGGLEDAERQMILEALGAASGNKTEAARLLRISRRRLYSRMKVHGIKP
jgi:DNA-binding NtrC family response regulator